jgi:hypothetical protein
MKSQIFNFEDRLMIIRQYIKEIRYLKPYILIVGFILVSSWALHYFLGKETMSELGKEDGLFEWLTAIAFLTISILFFLSYKSTRNIFYFIMGIIFIIGFGEEISWGYRIFHYSLPETVQKSNVSQEFNVHNIEIFNTMDLQKENKHGLERLLEIEFLFKIFTLAYCVALPFLVYHFRIVSRITSGIRLPVPPISLGFFFILNYLFYKVSNMLLVQGTDMFDNAYIFSFVETFEYVESVILLAVAYYFYSWRKIITPGKDIKQMIPLS